MIALDGFGLLDVVELAHRCEGKPKDVALVYYTVSDRLRIDELMESISQLPRGDRWTTLARMAIRYDVYGVLASITRDVLDATTAGDPAEGRVAQWTEANEVNISRVRNTLALLSSDEQADLATLSVLLRQMRTIVRTS